MKYNQNLINLHVFSPGWARDDITGIMWMLAKSLVFSVISVIVSKISKNIHAFEVFFLTMLVRWVCLLPWVLFTDRNNLKIRMPACYIIRSLLTTISLVLWFYVLQITAVTEATAISYTAPIFTVVFAAIFFGEKLGIKHISALIAGFVGAMIILRPGVQEMSLGMALAFITAIIWALADIVTKVQAHSVNIWAQTFYHTLLMLILSAPLAYSVWSMPTGEEVIWIIIAEILFILNNIALTLSFASTNLTVVAPFSFARLVFTALLAYFVLNEQQEIWDFIGGLIIMAGNLFLLMQTRKNTEPESGHIYSEA